MASLKEKEKEKEYINDYVESLTEDEQKALAIAQDHLKTSFDMVKSIHYQKWLLLQKNKIDINKK